MLRWNQIVVPCFAAALSHAQTTWCVDAASPGGNGTASAPFATIQAALDALTTVNGDTISVAAGTYAEAIRFGGKNVRVVGAGASSTTIDASGFGRAAVIFNAGETSAAHLSGFRVTGGVGSVGWNGYGLGQGGGVLCVGSSPLLEDLEITGNSASHGGGIQLYAGANATIRRCSVHDNYAAPDGAGIYVRGCHSPLIEDTTVRNNHATTWGGGFYFSDDVDAVLRRVLVVDNSSGAAGGAFILQSARDPLFESVTIANNSAGSGGAFFLYHAGWPANHGVLRNSIVWNNSGGEVVAVGGASSGTITGTYTNFRGGLAGQGNLNIDPLFAHPAGGDYSLSALSPCIDAGDPTSPTDPDGSRIDMGALTSSADISTYCTGKTNSIGCVPAVTWIGQPSLSTNNFRVLAFNVLNNKTGLFFWGRGESATPFFGGWRCVQYPVVRTPLQGSAGSPSGIDCTGSWSFTFSTPYAQSFGLVAGDWIYGQFWGRDPGFAAPNNVSLSDAVRFVLRP